MLSRRRRSPRHGRRAGWPGRRRNREANFSKSKGAAVQRDARGAHEGARPAAGWPPGIAAGVSSPWNWSSRAGHAARSAATTCAAGSLTNSSTGVTKGGRRARQLGGALRRDEARALRVQHEADRVGAGLHGGVHVLLARQAADLDAGAASERSASWQPIIRSRAAAASPRRQSQRRRTPGPRKYRPSGEKVGAAASRLARRQHLAHPFRRLRGPGRSRTRQPMMLRIMWCRKALASKSKRQ